MIKVPATAAGLPAVRTLIGEGVCVNVTLIFSLARYEQVMEAYLAGLEDRAARGEPLAPVVSVASFFVSRVDSKVDAAIERRLAALPPDSVERAELADLRGQAAVANARSPTRASARSSRRRASPRSPPAARGCSARCGPRPARRTRPTRDTLYVDELIGPDTVNTIPPQDAGAPTTTTACSTRACCAAGTRRAALFRRLPELGVPVDALIGELEEEGVDRLREVVRVPARHARGEARADGGLTVGAGWDRGDAGRSPPGCGGSDPTLWSADAGAPRGGRATAWAGSTCPRRCAASWPG